MPNIARITQADKKRMRDAAKDLEERIKTDPNLARMLKKEPRTVLGAIGMPEDVQNEYLKAQGYARTLPCTWTCSWTCWFTDWL